METLTTLSTNSNNPNIVFFDGVCGLCNKLVDFLLRIDRKNNLVFAPLQGETAKKYLTESQIKDLDTIVYRSKGKNLFKSTAVIQLLTDVGGMWRLCSVFTLFPRFVRDGIYDFVAKNRFKWYGRRATCRMPTEFEKNKILI